MKKLTLLLITGLLLLCSNVFAQAPLKTLSGVTVKQIKVYADSSQAIPGKSFKFGVEILTQQGAGKTKGWLNGEIGWKEFDIKVVGGEYNFTAPGLIVVSEKQTDFLNDHIRISVTFKDKPSITASLDVPVIYANENKLFFYGSTGATGGRGADGSFNAGGTGIAQKGENGAKGFSGPKIEVYIKPITLNGRNILEARIVNTLNQKETILKIDPNGGKLIITSTGGQGGLGGQGGAGDKSYEKCFSSDGAPGGNGGNGGDGGEIIFYFESGAGKSQSAFVGYSVGGKAGDGGKGGAGGVSTSCKTSSTNSKAGAKGSVGADGMAGQPGPAPKYVVK